MINNCKMCIRTSSLQENIWDFLFENLAPLSP